jgi:phage terminase large subunit-like protein
MLFLDPFTESRSKKNSKSKSFPVFGGKRLRKAERSELVEIYTQSLETENVWLKKQIIENNRIDLLATEILGYEVKPLHLALLRFQFLHPENLQLVYRGAGKSSMCTVTKTIHLLLKNANIRILIASKTTTNAQGFLKEIKAHFEKNDKLIEVFGPYYDPRLTKKWDEREIEVLPRTKYTKEANVTCVGVDGTVVSKHYDVIISDDLIDESNSRTEHMRKKTQTFFYNTLEPTLEAPDPEVPHRGEHHKQGTRFHYDDLYGHLIKNELKDHHQIIRALNENGQSPWPERHSPEWFLEKLKKSGLIIFGAQYLCDTEAMKGKIFQYDDCQVIESGEIPEDLKIFMGIDLAIGEKEENDNFVIVIVGVDTNKNYYILDFYEGKIRFSKQTRKIKEYYKKWDPIRALIETNAYQEAQYQRLKDNDKSMRIKPKKQHKDKISRAWKRSGDFDNKNVFFKKTGKSHIAVERCVMFPDGEGSKDFFDAMDLAFKASNLKRRKSRKEPGLIG